ncbi:MAG: type II secretion system F family protein [Kiritimatiellia bacterium]
MAKYRFVAVDSKGKELSGSVEAASEGAATTMLKDKGYFPTSISETGPGTSGTTAGGATASAKPSLKKPSTAAGTATSPGTGATAPGAKKSFSFGGGSKKQDPTKPKSVGFMARVKTKELVTFTRQLSTLVDAGLPLVRSLEVLNKQEKNPLLKRSLVEMSESINSGSTFAEAMSAHPKIFDKLYVNMVRAGEAGGVLNEVLTSLADFMEKMQKIKNKVVSAMVYPMVVLGFAMIILTFLMIFIVPRFEQIFKDILGDKELPMITRIVTGVSRAFVDRWYFVFGGFAAIVVGIIMAMKTEKGKRVWDKIKFNAPVFGALIRKTAIARFTRTLGTLMESGVPVLQALTIVGDTAGNSVVADAVKVVHDAVKEGENMAPPIESTNIFPPMVVSMVEVGEETGELPQMLARIADTYDDEVDNAVAALTSIIEPLMIVFLAVIVGIIVISLFMPMIGIIQGIQG